MMLEMGDRFAGEVLEGAGCAAPTIHRPTCRSFKPAEPDVAVCIFENAEYVRSGKAIILVENIGGLASVKVGSEGMPLATL